MRPTTKSNGWIKWVVGAIVIMVVAAVSVYAFLSLSSQKEVKPEPVVERPKVVETVGAVKTVIGTSVEGRKIEAYAYGKGETHIAFVGGIHGGYEWNSVVLAYEFLSYLDAHPEVIPKNLTITVVPSANPDGLYSVVKKEGRVAAADFAKISSDATIPGRFNANKVDLNRNFDCKWQPKSTWKSKTVSAGTAAFSEPESVAIRSFVSAFKPVAVVFWHSQGGNVYASRCEDGTLPETLAIMKTYARASGYNAVETFSAYATTGDADAWLASINIPAITVELTTHTTIEWEKNLAGFKAVLGYYTR